MGGNVVSETVLDNFYNKEKINSRTRIQWIDIAKGLGIVLVIIGHLLISTSTLCAEIYTFHIPLFFFLSGYVFNGYKYNFKDFIKKKFKTLIIPYIFLGIPVILYTFLKMYTLHDRNIINYTTILFNFVVQIRTFTLWFIACLFCLNVMFFILEKVLKNDYVKLGLAVITLSIFGLIYYKIGGINLPWNIDICFVAILFFYVGYLFKNIKQFQDIIFNKKYIIFNLIVFVVLNIICGYIALKLSKTKVDMFYNHYGFPPLSCISAFAGIFAMIIICKLIGQIKVFKCIEYIGANSLIYFAWHNDIMISLINKAFMHFNIFQSIYLSLVIKIVKLSVMITIICGVLTLLNYFIRKSKLKFIVGM